MPNDSVEEFRLPMPGSQLWANQVRNGASAEVDRERARRTAIYARQIEESGRITYLPRHRDDGRGFETAGQEIGA